MSLEDRLEALKTDFDRSTKPRAPAAEFTWKHRAHGGSWKLYPVESMELLTTAYLASTPSVDLGRWTVDLTTMRQRTKGMNRSRNVLALDKYGNVLPRVFAPAAPTAPTFAAHTVGGGGE